MEKFTLNNLSLVVWFGQWAMHAIKTIMWSQLADICWTYDAIKRNRTNMENLTPKALTKKEWWETWSTNLISIHLFFFWVSSSHPGTTHASIRWRNWRETPRKMPSNWDEISQFPDWSSYFLIGITQYSSLIFFL